jgi:hypothetical protein
LLLFFFLALEISSNILLFLLVIRLKFADFLIMLLSVFTMFFKFAFNIFMSHGILDLLSQQLFNLGIKLSLFFGQSLLLLKEVFDMCITFLLNFSFIII